MTGVPALVKCVALHITIQKVKAELDQFMSGLSEAGMLSAIQTYSEVFECACSHVGMAWHPYIILHFNICIFL